MTWRRRAQAPTIACARPVRDLPIDGHTLHHILYTSRLAADRRFDVVAEIGRTSRRGNALWGIRSVLLFDGQRFAQRIVGPAVAVRGLMQRILADPRHTAIRMLHDAEGADLDVEPSPFLVGYCGSAELDLLDRAGRDTGAAALAAFQAIVESAYFTD